MLRSRAVFLSLCRGRTDGRTLIFIYLFYVALVSLRKTEEKGRPTGAAKDGHVTHQWRGNERGSGRRFEEPSSFPSNHVKRIVNNYAI